MLVGTVHFAEQLVPDRAALAVVGVTAGKHREIPLKPKMLCNV
jgi:hypothetical protein